MEYGIKFEAEGYFTSKKGGGGSYKASGDRKPDRKDETDEEEDESNDNTHKFEWEKMAGTFGGDP